MGHSSASTFRAQLDGLATSGQELLGELDRLKARVSELEAENQGFAERFVALEEHHELLQNLVVSSHRLHASLDPAEVVTVVLEIVVHLVGAERFGIWMLDEHGQMSLLAGEGVEGERRLSDPELATAMRSLEGDAAYREPGDEVAPLAVVPMQVDGKAVGVLVIRALLPHKPELRPVDREILRLLSGEAATALAAARLHSDKARKLGTMRAFFDYMKETR